MRRDDLILSREQVVRTFQRVLERPVNPDSIDRFRGFATVPDLARHLRATPEYRARQESTRPGNRVYEKVPAPRLYAAEFQARQIRAKNGLTWPLRQVFVSREARVIYCPIGKVACTFLKRQMVRISQVQHKEQILEHVHALTDRICTGMQLSDYPLDEARAMIADPDMIRFAILRDPAERLLSAYVEKFVVNRNDPSNIHHTDAVVRAVQQAAGGGDTPDYDRGISFRAFIDHVLSVPPQTLDPHWRPQSLYLEGIVYDRIYRMDQLDAVIDLLEERSGQTLPRVAQNVTNSGKGSARPGAADLHPAEILAAPRIDKTSFLEPVLMDRIRSGFRDDYAIILKTYEDAPS